MFTVPLIETELCAWAHRYTRCNVREICI